MPSLVELLEATFRAHGATVTVEAQLEGRSGTVYTVPILAEENDEATLVMGHLDDGTVPDEVIQELLATVQDTGATRGILCHAGAAPAHVPEGITLWDRNLLSARVGNALVSEALESDPGPLELDAYAEAAATSLNDVLPDAFLEREETLEVALPDELPDWTGISPEHITDDADTGPVLPEASAPTAPAVHPSATEEEPTHAWDLSALSEMSTALATQEPAPNPEPPVAQPAALPPPPSLPAFIPPQEAVPEAPVAAAAPIRQPQATRGLDRLLAEHARTPVPRSTLDPGAGLSLDIDVDPLTPFPEIPANVAPTPPPPAPRPNPPEPTIHLPPAFGSLQAAVAPARSRSPVIDAEAKPSATGGPSGLSSLVEAAQALARPPRAEPNLLPELAPTGPAGHVPRTSHPLLPVRVSLQEARKSVSEKLFGFRHAELLLQPVHFFDYEVDLFKEGSLATDTADGRIQVHGSDKTVSDIDPDVANPEAQGQPIPAMPSTERVMRVSSERARQLAIAYIAKKHTRAVDVRIPDHRSSIYYAERRKVEPQPEQIRLQPAGIYIRPIWRLHGSNGQMDVDAVDGHEVDAMVHGHRTDAIVLE